MSDIFKRRFCLFLSKLLLFNTKYTIPYTIMDLLCISDLSKYFADSELSNFATILPKNN